MMDKVEVLISKENSGLTIKEYLKAHHVGRGRVESIRVLKHSYINNEYKSLETKLKEGDKLSFCFEEGIDFVPEKQPVDIIYEDDYLLAVNKPSGIIIHPDDKSKTGTLVNRVAAYYEEKQINRNIRYLHRIDKDTTGIVLFAKDFLTEAMLLQDIENNKIDRKYIGIIDGNLSVRKGVIDSPIGEDRHKNRMCVSKNGKPSKTGFELISHFKNYDEVMFTLFTGRTHQIRVHSAYIKHPILGDGLYGKVSPYIKRVALHCFKLAFNHPIYNKEVSIQAELPEDIKRLIK